ncbi:MAG: Flagellar biosynthesis protein FliO, partial [uncultured Acetobacteraceae bacterium]
ATRPVPRPEGAGGARRCRAARGCRAARDHGRDQTRRPPPTRGAGSAAARPQAAAGARSVRRPRPASPHGRRGRGPDRLAARSGRRRV